MLTWKVWTTAADPLFEGERAEAQAYIIEKLSDSRDVVLESPDGESYGYQDGVWTCLDTGAVWNPEVITLF